MSVNLYWYKPPSERKELGSSYDIKWPLAKRYGNHDGSCHEEIEIPMTHSAKSTQPSGDASRYVFTLGEDDIGFLDGLLASGKYPDAEKMIEDIRKYGSIDIELK